MLLLMAGASGWLELSRADTVENSADDEDAVICAISTCSREWFPVQVEVRRWR